MIKLGIDFEGHRSKFKVTVVKILPLLARFDFVRTISRLVLIYSDEILQNTSSNNKQVYTFWRSYVKVKGRWGQNIAIFVQIMK